MTIPYTLVVTLLKVSNLEDDMSQAMSWFKTNQMVANQSKFQVILIGLKTNDSVVLDIGGVSIDVVNSVKLLGVTIDSKLKFDQHVENLCQKANNKISAFSRVSNYLNQKQSLLLYKTFIMSQFNYCLLIWMFCGKVANNDVNRTNKRALRILFNDFTSSFEELLLIKWRTVRVCKVFSEYPGISEKNIF